MYKYSTSMNKVLIKDPTSSYLPLITGDILRKHFFKKIKISHDTVKGEKPLPGGNLYIKDTNLRPNLC
jgi:hypothetical protein